MYDVEAMRSDQWQTFQDSSKSFGFSKSAFWLRLSCSAAAKQMSILAFGYPNLTDVEAFQRADDKLSINKVSFGGHTDYRSHPIFYRLPAFRLTDFDLERSIFVRIASLGSLQFPMRYYSTSSFQNHVSAEYLCFGLYYGLLAAIAIYNFFLFLSSRERVFALYSMYVVTFGLFQMSMNGLAQQYLWPFPSWWSVNSISIEIPVFLFCMVMFAKAYLGKTSIPKVCWFALHAIQGITAVLFFAAFYLSYKDINQINADMCFITVALLLVTGAYGVRARKPAAKYYTLAWSLFLVGLGLFALRNLGVIPSNFLTTYAIQIGSASEVMLLSIGLGARLRILRDDKAKAETDLAESRTRFAASEAVSRMTEMLAHDVRKPFSILRMGLVMLGGAKDPADVKRVLSRLRPEIDKAIGSVDGLIADVMEVGSTSTQLIQEYSTPEVLIEATLGETFRIYPKAEIAIAYDLQHTHMVDVHVQKVGRVLSNIVGNAVQAMGKKGAIWFKTREREGLVEFRVGNAGSIIPHESLPKLFDAFFTSGKKGGTGLGLAIAEKVVKAHGGKIWCESAKTLEHPDGYVEFSFTLPVAATHVSAYKGKLPNHSSDITKALLGLTDHGATSASTQSAEELKLETDVAAASKKLGRPLKILLVDDEEVYRSGLVGMLTHSPELAAAVAISQACTSDEALGLCESMPFDLAITDVDLGRGSPIDGFDLVEAMRTQLNAKQRDEAVICVLSNRIVPSDHKTAIAKGADAFISKPISSVALLKLLIQTFQSVRVVEEQVMAAIKIDNAKHRPSVAILDDNIFILEAWTDALGADSRVFSFASPEELLEALEKDPNFLNTLACVVTDFHFDNSTVYDGMDVGKLVKSRRPGIPVLLSSDGEMNGLDLAGSIDHVIAKAPASLETLIQRYSL
jgi:signal transduction histidine kinase/CheY-like chemotaxis protein